MGIIWKSMMVLLSTLAALVIIVHSLEEDLETEFRRGLRPRALDKRTRFEQPWRAVEIEPSQQVAMINTHVGNFQEEPLTRRRPVRKRKRRPHPKELPREGPYPDEPILSYRETDYQTTEMSRRRRKRPDVRPRWIDEFVQADSQTPSRRVERPLDPEKSLPSRGYRRKLPTEPRLSEFNIPDVDENIPEKYDRTQTESVYASDTETNVGVERMSNRGHGIKINDNELNKQHGSRNKDITITDIDDQNFDSTSVPDQQLKEDKSLSEFSIEDINPFNTSNENILQVEKHKVLSSNQSLYLDNFDKALGNDPLDPETLKRILKRSKGASLSEILQKHNLSLSDLLHGRENAISLFKSQDSLEYHRPDFYFDKFSDQSRSNFNGDTKENSHSGNKDDREERISKQEYVTKNYIDSIDISKQINLENTQSDDSNINLDDTRKQNMKETIELKDNLPKFAIKHRLPTGIRRKLRMKPMLNNTGKNHLNRDLIVLNRTQNYNSRNTSKEWKNLISETLSVSNETNIKAVEEDTFSATGIPDEFTTMLENLQTNYTILNGTVPFININSSEIEREETIPSNPIIIDIDIVTTTDNALNITEKPKMTPILRLAANNSTLRRQAYNNRLKRKRLKQKNSTTQNPQDDTMQHLFGNANLVSASEFIARVQTTKATHLEDYKDLHTVNNPLTAQIRAESNNLKFVQISTIETTTIPMTSSTDSAKIDIEEILNDSESHVRLSKILMERNMSFNELFEHRERGSSHIHLADIFHNASKEPNPPEPFLSKSLLEPISKETYPLRALLEASLYEPTGKATTTDPNQTVSESIPVVMNFGNNVNENGENMGIMSLFSKLPRNSTNIETSISNNDLEETLNATLISNVDLKNNTNSTRESRVLSDNSHDIVSWNEIFALNRENHDNETKEDLESFTKGMSSEANRKTSFEEDIDGDGIIVLEDLQHLKDVDSKLASSEETLEINMFERSETTSKANITNYTKSVTVATASIVGLIMILFLLTYAIFKWRQQRALISKNGNFHDDRIPSPIFENRKGHKNNSSSRSISPMLSSANIYTMNTLDLHSGKESPDYMGWDTLKPFQ